MTSESEPITPNSRVALSAGLIVTGVIALVAAGWEGANRLRDIRDSIGGLEQQVLQLRLELTWHQRETWTVTDMVRWSYRLETINRATDMKVPDPHTIHPPHNPNRSSGQGN